jgi:hypothetical protein
MGDGEAGSIMGKENGVHSYAQVQLDTCQFAYDYKDDLQLSSHRGGHKIER